MPFAITTDMELIAEDFAIAADVGVPELQKFVLESTATEVVLERYALLDRLVPLGASDAGAHLRDSKHTDPVVITGASVENFEIVTRLTKTIPVGPDGDMVPLYWILVNDRRAFDIPGPKGLPNKQAMFWEGAKHPVRSVHMSFRPGDTWGEEAQAESLPKEIAMFEAAGIQIAYSIVGLLGP